MAAGAVPTPEWMEHAVCRVERVPVEVFFPRMAKNGGPAAAAVERRACAQAKSICARCPVRLQCLKDDLAHGSLSDGRYRFFGVFGGLTPSERKAIARRGLTVRQTMEMTG